MSFDLNDWELASTDDASAEDAKMIAQEAKDAVPEITLSKSDNGYTITVTQNGSTTTQTAYNGEDGSTPLITAEYDSSIKKTIIKVNDVEIARISDGADGTSIKGDTGDPAYLHIAYANSSDGLIDFSTTDGEGKSYIGQYTDSTKADSTTPSDYTWTLIKGEKGETGAAGEDGVVPVVTGTQTGATGAWTGVAPFATLEDKQRITYWLPYNGSGNATLNLTLSNGSTTGAIPCYYGGTTRLTTHFKAGNAIELTYRENVTIGSTEIEKGWWANANYYSDTTDNCIVYFANKTGAIGIFANSLFMEDSSGTYQGIVTSRNYSTSKSRNTNGFKIGANIYYTTTTYAANTEISGYGVVYSMYGHLFDYRLSFNAAQGSLTGSKPIYLVGSVSKDLFYLDETWWTQTSFTEGKIYILAGSVYPGSSTYRMTLYENNPWYIYDGSNLISYEKWVADCAAKTATNYLSYDSTNGLVVGNQTEGTLGGNVQITGDPAVNLRNGSDILAKFTTNQLLLSGGEHNTTYASITAYDDGDDSWGIFGGTSYARFESNNGNSSTTGLTTFTTQGSTDSMSYALLHTHTNTTHPCAAIELFNLSDDYGGYKQGLNVFCGDYHGKLAFFPAGSVYIATNNTSPVDIFQGSFTQITPTTTAKVTTPLARVQKNITINTGACTANYLRAYTMGGMCFVTGQVTPTSAGTNKMLLYISGVEPMYQTMFPIAAYGHGSSEGYVKKVNSGQSHIYFNIPETGDWKFNFAFATTTSTEEQSFSITSDLKFWESNGWVATDDPLETT